MFSCIQVLMQGKQPHLLFFFEEEEEEEEIEEQHY